MSEHSAMTVPLKGCQSRDRIPMSTSRPIARRCSAKSSKDVRMATPIENHRINSADCLRLARTMDTDNKQRLERIARQWLEMAAEEEQKHADAVE
jgi:hypothetical protein